VDRDGNTRPKSRASTPSFLASRESAELRAETAQMGFSLAPPAARPA
jgi:hypothetical protein